MLRMHPRREWPKARYLHQSDEGSQAKHVRLN